MFRVIGIIIAVTLAAATAGCAGVSHMTTVPAEEQVQEAEPGKALVYFIRATTLGGGIPAYLYDGEKYVGTVLPDSHIGFQAAPGEHMFMLTGDTADFMRADLLPDKIYYVVVEPYMGYITYRFALRPMNGQVSQEKIDKWLESTRQLDVDEDGERWAASNTARASKFKNKYLAKWEEKPEDAKQFLRPESGK